MGSFAPLSERIKELASEKPVKLLLKYSWPALVAMTLSSLYTVVDRAFIGHGCGVDATAGLTLAMPLMMLFGAFGVLVGAGHAAVLSIKLGEGDRVSCEKLVGQLIFLKVLFFLILPPLVFFNIDFVIQLSGGENINPAAREAAREYIRLVVFSHIFSHLAFGLSALHRAEGGALRSMYCMIVGFGLNLLLDPLLIFGFRMGVAGAAWATNISMFASCIWAFGYYLRGVTAVRLRLKRIWFYPKLAVRSLSIGLSPFLQHLMSSVIAFSLQYAFVKWMPDEMSRTARLASLGVFQGSLILVFMPMLGAQQGLQPIFGYNWGARNYNRVYATLKTGLLITGVLSFVAFVLLAVPPFNYWMAAIFIDSSMPHVVDMAAGDIQLANCMIWCIFLNVVATTFFQSIGRPGVAIFLSMLRQGLCLLPLIWIMPYFIDNKAVAIWLSMPISDVVCNFVTIIPLLTHARFMRKVRSRSNM